jgi:putative spermidine/putrescine transport system ATP-binding protein
MNAGHIEQVGAPFEIYNYPRTPFVASFVGTLNILPGKIVDPAAGRILVDGHEIRAVRGIEASAAGDERQIALRPEAITLNGAGGGRNEIQGTIVDVNFLGAVVRIRVKLTDSTIDLDTFNNAAAPPPKPGERVTLSFAPEDVLMLESAAG